jgi:segregation and condensation protein A
VIAIAVKTENFEGPIELLLRMIERRKLAINEVSLAAVTDEYVERLRSLPGMNYSLVTHFVYIASTLMLIKSRSLLPKMELTEEEEEQIDTLEKRLRKYQIISESVQGLRKIQGLGFAYARPYKTPGIVFAPDTEQITQKNMQLLLHNLLQTLPEKENLPEARVEAVVHIEDMMESITQRIQKGLQVSFRSVTRDATSRTTSAKAARVTLVVGFLAMLEMVRNGLVHALQENHFHDITLNPSQGDGIINE